MNPCSHQSITKFRSCVNSTPPDAPKQESASVFIRRTLEEGEFGGRVVPVLPSLKEQVSVVQNNLLALTINLEKVRAAAKHHAAAIDEIIAELDVKLKAAVVELNGIKKL